MSELATEDSCTSTQGNTIWDRTPAGRLFARVLNFEMVLVSTLMLLPVMLSEPIRNPSALLQDPDIWWHLADARHLFASGFIRMEPYSFSVAGKPWMNPEWLAEIPYWLGFSSFGLHGLLIVTIIVVELNVLGIYLLAKQRTGHVWTSVAATAPGIWLMTVNIAARTILWGYVCLVIELAILEAWKRGHRRLLWFLPPLFALWINIHGSWAIGALIFLVFAGSKHISFSLGDIYSERRPWGELRQLWTVTALSVAAIFINPYGWKMVWNPVDMALHQKLNIANVQEWHALPIQSIRGDIVVALVAVFLIANSVRRRRWELFEIFLVAFGFYAAFDHIRFCFLLAILAMPSLAFDLHRTWFSGENPNQKRPLLNGAVILALCAIAAAFIPSAARTQRDYNRLFPIKLITQVQPDWRLFNSEEIGGVLAFNHKPDFLDSRLDTFDHHGVLAAYLNAIYIQNTLAILDRYKIDHILFEKKTPFVYLLLHTGGWKQIGEQNGFVLLARKSKQGKS